MEAKHVDVWKYPHMTYKKAFALATGITVIAVGLGFWSFSGYIASHQVGPMQVNFLTDQEANQVVEKVKEQQQEEQRQEPQKMVRPNDANTAGGAGHGGQAGSSAVPTKSAVTPTAEKAQAGEAGSLRASDIGNSVGSGMAGDPGEGIGNAESGSGQGTSTEQGDGGDAVGQGGGTFDPYGYRDNLQAYVDNNYPAQAVRMGITGTVVLVVTFGPSGDVTDVEVASSDDPILTEHAVNAAWSIGGAENSTGESHSARIPISYVLE